MESDNKKRILIGILALSLALVAGCVFYYLKDYAKQPTRILELLEREGPKTFGGKIHQGLQNPGERIPQTNPFKAEINPFEELKINPFDQAL